MEEVKKRPVRRDEVRIITSDLEIVASTYSWGLYLWMMTLTDENKQKIFVPYHPLFISMIINTVHQKYSNKSFLIPDNLTKGTWYDNLPANLHDPKNVKQSLSNQNTKVCSYEKVCLDLLTWLAKLDSDFEFDSEATRTKHGLHNS